MPVAPSLLAANHACFGRWRESQKSTVGSCPIAKPSEPAQDHDRHSVHQEGSRSPVGKLPLGVNHYEITKLLVLESRARSLGSSAWLILLGWEGELAFSLGTTRSDQFRAGFASLSPAGFVSGFRNWPVLGAAEPRSRRQLFLSWTIRKSARRPSNAYTCASRLLQSVAQLGER